MAYQRWSRLVEKVSEDPANGARSPLFGEGAYPALFNLGEGIGFFALCPGQELLYYYDPRQDIAFLFPNLLD